MKTLVCELCAVTGGLCAGCQAKLDRGQITQADVSLARALYKLKDRFALDAVEVSRCFDCGNILYVFAQGDAGHLIGKRGKVAAELGKEMGKHVRVVHATKDAHLLAEEILLPVKPLGVNAVFHEGREAVKIRLPKREATRLPAKPDALQTVFAAVFNKPVQIAFE